MLLPVTEVRIQVRIWPEMSVLYMLLLRKQPEQLVFWGCIWESGWTWGSSVVLTLPM